MNSSRTEDLTPSKAKYDVKPCAASRLTPADFQACFAIIGTGGAVGMASMRRDLPRAAVVVVARFHNGIVGIGVIKPVRKQYAMGIAAKSGFAFPAETQELGYVAVHPDHQGKRLSQRITDLLLSQHSGRMFATTDDDRMKKTLKRAGFSMKGREWRGKRGMLSYWERG
jgi:GNAT superfamily N-acetyltransferase